MVDDESIHRFHRHRHHHHLHRELQARGILGQSVLHPWEIGDGNDVYHKGYPRLNNHKTANPEVQSHEVLPVYEVQPVRKEHAFQYFPDTLVDTLILTQVGDELVEPLARPERVVHPLEEQVAGLQSQEGGPVRDGLEQNPIEVVVETKTEKLQ